MLATLLVVDNQDYKMVLSMSNCYHRDAVVCTSEENDGWPILNVINKVKRLKSNEPPTLLDIAAKHSFTQNKLEKN